MHVPVADVMEPGEIEAHLLRHPQVIDAVVLANGDESAERWLAVYVAADLTKLKAQQRIAGVAGADVIARWNRLYDLTYSSAPAGFDFVGWNSSYTRQPIPENQMRDWLLAAAERILALNPRRVLEIGCGLGLLLQQLAPTCAAYVGTELSASALLKLRQWIAGRGDLKHVELLHLAAAELRSLESGRFDTVILNSVVQYFPDIEYLLSVLHEAVRLVRPGGKIFLGDVRHLGLLQTFHCAVQLSKAADSVTVGELRRRVANAVAQERELSIDPEFFEALPARLAGISAAQVHLKRGRVPEELVKYRYDVVLHTGDATTRTIARDSVKWESSGTFSAELEHALSRHRQPATYLDSIPNARLSRDEAARKLVSTEDRQLSVGALRRRLEAIRLDGVDPEQFWKWGEAYGYQVTLGWDSREGPERFTAKLVDGTQVAQVGHASSPDGVVKSWSSYANDPQENSIGQQLVLQLHEFLQGHVPAHAIPSEWVVLKQLPRMGNGEIDRCAL